MSFNSCYKQVSKTTTYITCRDEPLVYFAISTTTVYCMDVWIIKTDQVILATWLHPEGNEGDRWHFNNIWRIKNSFCKSVSQYHLCASNIRLPNTIHIYLNWPISNRKHYGDSMPITEHFYTDRPQSDELTRTIKD